MTQIQPQGPSPTFHADPQFVGLALHDDRLYGVGLENGALYPLYVYGPLQQAIDADDLPPFAGSWPLYVTDYVSQYVPLPVILADIGDFIAQYFPDHSLPEELLANLPQIFLPTVLRDHISMQSRAKDPLSPWSQTTYKYWPLYYVRPGVFVDEDADHPMMFLPATLSLVTLTPPNGKQEDGDVTFPPASLGP